MTYSTKEIEELIDASMGHNRDLDITTMLFLQLTADLTGMLVDINAPHESFEAVKTMFGRILELQSDNLALARLIEASISQVARSHAETNTRKDLGGLFMNAAKKHKFDN